MSVAVAQPTHGRWTRIRKSLSRTFRRNGHSDRSTTPEDEVAERHERTVCFDEESDDWCGARHDDRTESGVKTELAPRTVERRTTQCRLILWSAVADLRRVLSSSGTDLRLDILQTVIDKLQSIIEATDDGGPIEYARENSNNDYENDTDEKTRKGDKKSSNEESSPSLFCRHYPAHSCTKYFVRFAPVTRCTSFFCTTYESF